MTYFFIPGGYEEELGGVRPEGNSRYTILKQTIYSTLKIITLIQYLQLYIVHWEELGPKLTRDICTILKQTICSTLIIVTLIQYVHSI